VLFLTAQRYKYNTQSVLYIIAVRGLWSSYFTPK